MAGNGILQILLLLTTLILLVKPLGWYMAQVYQGNPCGLDKILSPVERLIYRLSRINPDQDMNWKTYLSAMLVFNGVGWLFFYVLLRLQAYAPLNPQAFSAVSPDLAFNTASSFITNTNWQAYGGENTLSYLSQMLALTVQNFLSAATGLSLLMAVIRGLVQHEQTHLGNFWVDTVRGTLYILLPLALLLAVALASQGVMQNIKPYQTIQTLQPLATEDSHTQLLPMGPVASQVAIKQLGTNGGGFFNTNSAHPYENPTPLTNFLELIAMLLIPAALTYTFGMMVNDKRQGWAIFCAMLLMYIPLIFASTVLEQQGNPAFNQMGITQAHSHLAAGGNMEGKETRFGIVNSATWMASTTATSTGAINAMPDSFTPLAGMIPLWLMHTGEVVFGGVGSGLYGMIMIIIIAVFVSGLMVGRTPEYLGKKIEPYEMKMASFAVLIIPLLVLLLTAIAAITTAGTSALGNPGAHGFTELLYTFTSLGYNNGSSFDGLNSNTRFYNIVGGIEMLILRYWLAIATLAIAGSLARKKTIPRTAGTLSTHTLQFIIILFMIITIVGALSFFPALALGPIVEALTIGAQHGH